MPQYLLNIVQPVGIVPSDEDLAPVMAALARFNEELQEAGAWLFTLGLHQPDASTVVRADADGVTLADGPFAEGKEFVGGLWAVDSPDLDAALDWAAKAAGILGLPVEVRPIAHMQR